MAYRTIKPVIIDNAISLAIDVTGAPFSIEGFDRCSVEILVTGAPTGTVTVQASNDFVPSNIHLSPSESPANWVDIPLGLNALAGAAQNYYIDFTQTGIPWIRVNYVSTAGAGNLTTVVTAKEF